MNPQLELFPEKAVEAIREAAVRKAPERDKTRLRELSLAAMTEALQAALVAEGVAFTTWSIMSALRNATEPVSIVLLSTRIALSYHAIRNQILRNPWFETRYTGQLVALQLNDAGTTKIQRILNRLARHV